MHRPPFPVHDNDDFDDSQFPTSGPFSQQSSRFSHDHYEIPPLDVSRITRPPRTAPTEFPSRRAPRPSSSQRSHHHSIPQDVPVPYERDARQGEPVGRTPRTTPPSRVPSQKTSSPASQKLSEQKKRPLPREKAPTDHHDSHRSSAPASSHAKDKTLSSAYQRILSYPSEDAEPSSSRKSRNIQKIKSVNPSLIDTSSTAPQKSTDSPVRRASSPHEETAHSATRSRYARTTERSIHASTSNTYPSNTGKKVAKPEAQSSTADESVAHANPRQRSSWLVGVLLCLVIAMFVVLTIVGAHFLSVFKKYAEHKPYFNPCTVSSEVLTSAGFPGFHVINERQFAHSSTLDEMTQSLNLKGGLDVCLYADQKFYHDEDSADSPKFLIIAALNKHNLERNKKIEFHEQGDSTITVGHTDLANGHNAEFSHDNKYTYFSLISDGAIEVTVGTLKGIPHGVSYTDLSLLKKLAARLD